MVEQVLHLSSRYFSWAFLLEKMNQNSQNPKSTKQANTPAGGLTAVRYPTAYPVHQHKPTRVGTAGIPAVEKSNTPTPQSNHPYQVRGKR